MSNRTISLKTRVRYEGRAQTFDRRASADLEKLPQPLWYTVGQVLRSNFRKPMLNGKTTASATGSARPMAGSIAYPADFRWFRKGQQAKTAA